MTKDILGSQGPEHTIGQRIQWLMANKGLSQADLGRLIGIKSSSMSNLLNMPNRKPSATTLMRMCHVLDSNQDYIMRGMGDPHAKPMPSSDVDIHADLDKLPEEHKQAIHMAIKAFLATTHS